MSEEISTRFGRSLPADRYAYLRLEQLDEGSFAAAVRMCELSPADEVVGWWRETYIPGRVSKRRERASEEDLATIRAWIEPTQRWLGQI